MKKKVGEKKVQRREEGIGEVSERSAMYIVHVRRCCWEIVYSTQIPYGSIRHYAHILLHTTSSQPFYLHIGGSLATAPCSLTVSLWDVPRRCMMYDAPRWGGVRVTMTGWQRLHSLYSHLQASSNYGNKHTGKGGPTCISGIWVLNTHDGRELLFSFVISTQDVHEIRTVSNKLATAEV